MPQQPEVGGVTDDRANQDEINECPERAAGEVRGMKMPELAADQGYEQHENSTAKHLLRRAQECGGTVFGGSRIKRTRRPNERRHEKDGHADRRMMIAFA